MGDQKEVKKRWLKWLVLAVIVVVVLVLLYLLLNSNETYTSNKAGVEKKVAFVCSGSELKEEPFFVAAGAESVRHEIRGTFDKDSLNKITYVYDGTFGSDQLAETAEANLHGAYNIYMGERSIAPSVLKPVFSSADNTLKITLYAERSGLTGMTVGFFFLNADEFQRLRRYDIDQLVDIYENKGFTCTVYE